MHSRIAMLAILALAASASAGALRAQQPDSLTRSQRDSIAADSIRLVRELERMQAPASAAPTATQGPTNARLLPDISAVGDFIGDLSPKRSTQEDGTRFGVREVEIAVQAAVDPYFRGDIFLGISDAEGISIEQAYLTATSLPGALELRLGRFLMPFGKQTTTHRHDLHTIEYPWVVQRFFGPEGLKGTGVYLARVFAPFGFYQELQVTAVDRFGEADESLQLAEPVNKRLSGLAYSARVRNYWDLSEASNLELSGSALTGKREQPIELATAPDAGIGIAARQSVLAADLTFRWRPLQQGLYRSFILQAEVMRQMNEKDPALPEGASSATTLYLGPPRDVTGAYTFARYQTGRRTFAGARYDYVQSYDTSVDPDFHAASFYLEFFPSEFSKLVAGYERVLDGGIASGFGEQKTNRLILQATFALGPHKPHPF